MQWARRGHCEWSLIAGSLPLAEFSLVPSQPGLTIADTGITTIPFSRGGGDSPCVSVRAMMHSPAMTRSDKIHPAQVSLFNPQRSPS